jgi:hypothetical protein
LGFRKILEWISLIRRCGIEEDFGEEAIAKSIDKLCELDKK